MTRRGHARRRHVTAAASLAALCLLLVVGAALAAPGAPRSSDPPMTGAPWPAKRTIGIYDATPTIWQRSIEAAIADWNSSGLKVRFALVKTRSKAQVVMTSRKLKNMGGWATIGRSFGQGTVVLDAGHPPTVERPLDGQFIVTHELGHILGLDHARRACSVMNYAYLTVCPKPALGFRVCGHVRSADVKALAPAYGAVTKKLSSRFCPSPHDTHLDAFFFPSDDPSAFALVQINPAVPAGTALVVERRSGSCSSSRGAAAVTQRFVAGSTTGTDAATVDPATGARYAAGAYCYRYWVLDAKTKLTGTRFEHSFAFAG